MYAMRRLGNRRWSLVFLATAALTLVLGTVYAPTHPVSAAALVVTTTADSGLGSFHDATSSATPSLKRGR
jgi:hypothetical protein